MNTASLLTAGLLAAAASSPAARAAPPPPAVVPEHLGRPVDGYDSAALFQQWRYWIEERKGPVTEALLARPEVLDDAQQYGRPVLTYRFTGDLGHFLTGDVRVYCPPTRSPRFAREGCRYRLRQATVPADAAAMGELNPVASWMREAFDPVALAAHLRQSGIPPETVWWRVDRRRLFGAAPSPDEVLRRNALVESVDSDNCPALKTAMEALELGARDWRTDLPRVGADGPVIPPIPHAVIVNYSLVFRRADRVGSAILAGEEPVGGALIGTVLEAGHVCVYAQRSGKRP